MYIDPIHAGPVALAHALALAARVRGQCDGSACPESPHDAPAKRRFRPLRRLAQWWQRLDEVKDPTPEAVQMALWTECGGRPYATALSGLLLMAHLRRNLAAGRQKRAAQR